MAVAIRKLQLERRYERFAVIDLDVHQGDGTAQIFQDDPRVLAFSCHCKNNFPLRKQKSTIDVNSTRASATTRTLKLWPAAYHACGVSGPRLCSTNPEWILSASDVLGRLDLSLDGLKTRDRLVCAGTRKGGVPLVITLGGGYSNPIALTVEAHANTFLLARELFN